MRALKISICGALILAAVSSLGLAGAAPAPPAIPETPAGKALAAFLEAFNSGDPALIRAFDETYRPEPPLQHLGGGFREQTGGFNLLRVETSEPLSITGLMQEKSSDTVARFEIALNSDEKPKIVRQRMQAIPRPADLEIPRMTEAGALAAVSARAEDLAAKDQFSGVLLVAKNGEVLLQKAWGRANRETGAPVTLDTRFRLGSMNKMFTSVATLQLVEAGKLSLDDPLGQHFPEYPNKDVASKVTVRHLLTHTGGTGDIFGPDFAKNRLTLREHGDYVKLYGARGLTHEPGAEWRYSNYGFVLLGALIEKVSGMSYYDYVRTRVFAPAGMTSTDSLPETEDVPNRTVGYMKPEGGAWVPNTDTLPWRGTAAGGGYSTAGDLLRFAQALESGKLISKATLAQATTPFKENYGFGFGIRSEGAARSYGHSGGAPGMNGELRIYPRLGYVVVGLSNFDPPGASRLVDFFALRMPVTPAG